MLRNRKGSIMKGLVVLCTESILSVEYYITWNNAYTYFILYCQSGCERILKIPP